MNTTTTNPTTTMQIPVDHTPDCATEYTLVGNTLTPMRRALPQRLLGVWAHPDDEAYLSAGLMARVIAAGGSVTIVTATRGEKGTDDPDLYDSERFGQHRERELRSSLALLGVTNVRFLGLRDGECDLAAADIAAAIEDIAHEVQPDMIVTFGPDGMTNHPDHLAISRWTTEAWRRHGSGELLYATVTHDWAARHRELHDRIGVFGDFADGSAPSVTRSRVALECSLTDAELDRKRAALAAHGSQTAGLAEIMGEETYRSWYRNEHFRRPTRSEIDSCPMPVHATIAGERILAGAPA